MFRVRSRGGEWYTAGEGNEGVTYVTLFLSQNQHWVWVGVVVGVGFGVVEDQGGCGWPWGGSGWLKCVYLTWGLLAVRISCLVTELKGHRF